MTNALKKSALARFAAGVSLVALSVILSPEAHAQVQNSTPSPTQVADAERQDADIVVTATRRESSIQDVAAGIQVLDGKTIDQLSLDSFEEFVPSIAGIGFTQSGSGTAQLGLRGVSNVTGGDFGVGDSVSTVGLYFDDVPIQGGVTLPDIALYDLVQVEVLKGPQGTLFGEGAMGGVIRLIPNKPRLDAFEARGDATLSSTESGGENYQIRGVINIPIVNDRLGLRLSGTYKRDEGYIDNVATGATNINDNKVWSIRAALRAQLADTVGIDLLYLHDKGRLDGLNNFIPQLGDLVIEAFENRFNETNRDLFAGTVNIDLGEVARFTSVTSYFDDRRDFAERFPLNLNFLVPLLTGGVAVPAPGSRAENLLTTAVQKTFTQEIRLVSSGDGPFRWVLGGFYRDRDSVSETATLADAAPSINAALTARLGAGAARFLFPASGTPGTITIAPFLPAFERTADEAFKQKAIYGEANYELADKLRLTFGVRYYDERVSLSELTTGYGPIAVFTRPRNRQEIKNDGFLFKGGLDYRVNDDVLLYTVASEGFRSGGPNLNASTDPTGSIPFAFGSDSLWNFEGGFKTSWLDRRVTLNGAVYYQDWKDVQSRALVSVPLSPGAPPTVLGFIGQGADARVIGGEIELKGRPADWLDFGGALSVNDTEVTRVRPGSTLRVGDTLPRAPKLSGSAYVQVTRPLSGSLSGFARFDFQHVGEQIDSTGTPPVKIDELNVGRLRLGAYTKRFGVDVFVDNLWDTRPVLGRLLNFTSPISQLNPVSSIRPRTIGVTLRASY
jgi:iron complex outermembrane recepter protein